MASRYAALFDALIRQVTEQGSLGPVERLTTRWMFGERYRQLRGELDEVLDSYLKNNLVDEVDPEHVTTRLLLDDSSRADYGRKSRQASGDQLLSSWVEAISVFVSTSFLLPQVDENLSPDQRQSLVDWCDEIADVVRSFNRDFAEFTSALVRANPDHPTAARLHRNLSSVRDLWEDLTPEAVIEDHDPDPGVLRIMVAEDASGRPVSGLEVVFHVKEGDVQLAPTDEPDNRVDSLSVVTDRRGEAAVRFHHEEDGEYAVTASHDDLNFVTFPREIKLSRDYFDEHPDPNSLELRMIEYLSDADDTTADRTPVEALEYGGREDADRAVELQARLLEEEIRYLADQDVNLVRIDDHHPYTRELLESLNDLRKEGLIEDIRLSSLPRGEHQPKEEQRCGADLIYDGFVEDTPIDNEGMKRLQKETHLQDLHIEESPLAIELSKLIGSRFSKIEMAKGLMGVESESEMEGIMEIRGWDEVVRQYEEGLSRVLPRVETTLHRARLVIPPEEGSYEDHLDGEGLFSSLAGAPDRGKDRGSLASARAYARQTGRCVDFYAALSPFCDPEKDEPPINVASALNYLKPRHDPDYFFYAYGSFLLSSRRVNEDGYDIDLSTLVSRIGSPSDGGHASAATGSPSANPAFPVERFESVNDVNLTEYFYYVFDIVDRELDLDFVALEEQLPVDYEEGMDDMLARVRRHTHKLILTGDAGPLEVLVAKGEYPGPGEPDLPFPLVVSDLSHRHEPDYLFYVRSPKSLVMRNVSDPAQRLDLDRVSRTIGTYRDGGHPRAAQCQPKFNPRFDADRFEYINSQVLPDFSRYVGTLIVENHDVVAREVELIHQPATET